MRLFLVSKPHTLGSSDRSQSGSALAGKGACPPEDCGGVYGYARLLALLADPQTPEDAEIGEMYEGFDPSQFDVAAVNRTLAAIHRRWKT